VGGNLVPRWPAVEWIVGICRIGAANVEPGEPVMNFRQLDLNLLRVLCAIHRTGSVTEAGQQLALSQSATSNALARLRHCFGDALFVRSPSGLHPRGWRSASRRWWPPTCCSWRRRCATARASTPPPAACTGGCRCRTWAR
jgi:hypothetical protein